MPSALHAVRPVCRVGMSPLSRPTRHPSLDPEHFPSGQPLHGRPLQKCSPKIGRMSAPLWFGELSDDSDPNPHGDRHTAEDSPFLSPTRNPIRYAPASCPKRFNCTAVVYADGGALRTPAPTMYPAAAWRWALTVMVPRLRRGRHHRSPAKPTAPCTFRLWQPLWLVSSSPHKLPPGDPGLTASKRNAGSQNPDHRPRKLRELLAYHYLQLV